MISFAILAANQAAPVAVHDVGPLIQGVDSYLVVGLFAVVAWFIRRILVQIEERIEKHGEKLDALATTCEATNREVTSVRYELFGVSGENGLRSDVRRMSRTLDEHDLLLVRLAEKSGVQFPGSRA